MIGIGRDQFSIISGPLTAPPQPVVLDFPVDVRAIVVRGDEQARRSVRGVTIQPLSILEPRARLAEGVARRAVRYDGATVFFMDDRSFAEPEAFWVGGGRTSTVVVQPDAPGSVVRLLVRNGPTSNEVALQSRDWNTKLAMSAGEERQIELPSSGRAAVVTLAASAGFRPSDVDPKSRDTRFLGVWVKLVP
jgi:hypothetical protein